MPRRRGEYRPPGAFPDADAFRARLRQLGAALPCDDAVLPPGETPLAAPAPGPGGIAPNRFAIHPMEGWDGDADGRPGELTFRRWRRFGASGAGLIWGGEAVAVTHDGRANPRQLRIGPDTVGDIARLREAVLEGHREAHPDTSEPLVGLQLTHSGRWACPDAFGRRQPQIAFHHPVLDRKIAPDCPDQPVDDDSLRRIRDAIVEGARLAASAGFDFVDVKCCHGYLLHELLAARDRPGRYGGDLDGRSGLLRECVERIRGESPAVAVAVRLSVFDTVAFRPDPETGLGIPEPAPVPYRWGFGVDPDRPAEPDPSEALELVGRLARLGVAAVNVTAGCPYANPHLQRPALYPPSDGYLPPEDPLVGVARLVAAARLVRRAAPGIAVVATGFTYLQEFLPHVAQAVVRDGWADFVGLGRAILPYPDLPADLLSRGRLDRRRICRTFGDCTTAPRHGMVSGCYPLDAGYRARPEARQLRDLRT